MIETLKEIIDLIIFLVPLLISLLILSAKLSKNRRLRKYSESIIEIEKIVNKYMVSAEGFSNYSGNDKLEWVKTKVNQFCIENDINYNEEAINEIIERLIILTKKINQREKDKGGLLWKQ